MAEQEKKAQQQQQNQGNRGTNEFDVKIAEIKKEEKVTNENDLEIARLKQVQEEKRIEAEASFKKDQLARQESTNKFAATMKTVTTLGLGALGATTLMYLKHKDAETEKHRIEFGGR